MGAFLEPRHQEGVPGVLRESQSSGTLLRFRKGKGGKKIREGETPRQTGKDCKREKGQSIASSHGCKGNPRVGTITGGGEMNSTMRN